MNESQPHMNQAQPHMNQAQPHMNQAPPPHPMPATPLARWALLGLLLAGLLLQALAWSMALAGPGAAWHLVLLAHGASALLMSLGAWAWLPPALRAPPAGVLALLATLCLALPGLGPLALLLGLWRLHRPAAAGEAKTLIASIGLPAFDGNLGHATDLRVLGMAPRALRGAMPPAKRLQALMSLQALPSALSTRLLREALRDPEDEVRLVAYTVMDRQEQQLMQQLQAWQTQLQTSTDAAQQQRLRRRLVELHLELLHRQLAQGDWRQLLLTRAWALAGQSLQQQPRDATAHLHRGRLLWLQGEHAAARPHLERAAALGAPPSRTWPYLAELALRERNPALVRQRLAQLDPATLSPRLRSLRQFWVPDHA